MRFSRDIYGCGSAEREGDGKDLVLEWLNGNRMDVERKEGSNTRRDARCGLGGLGNLCQAVRYSTEGDGDIFGRKAYVCVAGR